MVTSEQGLPQMMTAEQAATKYKLYLQLLRVSTSKVITSLFRILSFRGVTVLEP